MINIQCQ